MLVFFSNRLIFNSDFANLMSIMSGVRLAVIVIVAIVLAVGGSWLSVGVVSAQDSELKFNEPPIIDLTLLRGTITKGEPAHIQVTIINSDLNDVSMVGEIILSLESTLFAFSTTSGATGGAVENFIEITNPIASGTAKAFDIWVQASPESPSVYKIDAVVRMWPSHPITLAENKKNKYEKKLPPEIGSVVFATNTDCYKKISEECTSEVVRGDCDEFACKPWGWFLIGYAVIASIMVSVVTVRPFFTRY